MQYYCEKAFWKPRQMKRNETMMKKINNAKSHVFISMVYAIDGVKAIQCRSDRRT